MSAAQRRKGRRLRSWWRHEQQSIAMALAEALHHSAGPSKKKVVERRERQEEAGSETYCAPRGPKTLPPGVRPAPLAEVAGPQGAATGGYVAARAPLLAVSSLRGSSSCGCGRLCEHVRHVPAVADLQWKVPPSISSTKWWTFQLCYGDRYGCLQVQFLDNVVFLPGIVQRLALLVLTVQIFALVPQLQFIDGRRHPCFCAVAVTYGPACCSWSGGRCPC